MRPVLYLALLVITLLTPTLVLAQEATPTPPAAIARQVIKQACASAFGYERLSELQAVVLAEAKRQAIAELSGELVTAFSQVQNFVVTQDQIRSISIGFVREGEVRYTIGSGLGEVCVILHAYTTVDDRSMFDPVLLVQQNRLCLQRPELSVGEVRELTRESALLEILWNYDRKLEDFAPKTLLRLFHQISYSQDGFLQDTDVYCVQAQGYILPVEVMALLSVPTPIVTSVPIQPITPTATASASSTAITTPTRRSFLTLTATRTTPPTVRPTNSPTTSATPTATHTMTPRPTQTPTIVPSPIPTATPRPTATPVPVAYIAPELITPGDGERLSVNDSFQLVWFYRHPLRNGDHFLLRVGHRTGYSWVVTDSTSWTVPRWLQDYQPGGGFAWWVSICRGAAVGEYANQPCSLVAPASSERRFFWATDGGSSGSDPTPTPRP